MKEIDVIVDQINKNLARLRFLYKEPNNAGVELFEFYHGDELIMVGTLNEISKYTTYAMSTLTTFSQESYLKKNEGKNVKRVVKFNA